MFQREDAHRVCSQWETGWHENRRFGITCTLKQKQLNKHVLLEVACLTFLTTLRKGSCDLLADLFAAKKYPPISLPR